MPLWILGLLVIGTSMAYYAIILAHKQEDDLVKQMGYLVGVIGIAAIAFSALLKVYYAFDALCRL